MKSHAVAFLAGLVLAAQAQAYSLSISAPSLVTPGQQDVPLIVSLDTSGSLASVDLVLTASYPGVSPVPLVFDSVVVGAALQAEGFTLDLVSPSTGADTSSLTVSMSSLAGLGAASGSVELFRVLVDIAADDSLSGKGVALSIPDATLGFNLPDPNSTATADGAETSFRIRRDTIQLPEPGGISLLLAAAASAFLARSRLRR